MTEIMSNFLSLNNIFDNFKFFNNNKNIGIFYFLNYDINYNNFLIKNNYNLIIYQGHQSVYNIFDSNIVFPTKNFIEQNNVFLNNLGIFEYTKKVFNLNLSQKKSN